MNCSLNLSCQQWRNCFTSIAPFKNEHVKFGFGIISELNLYVSADFIKEIYRKEVWFLFIRYENMYQSVIPIFNPFYIQMIYMQECSQIIPSHSVRAGSMERILGGMWHPSVDEIQQNKLYLYETRKVHEKLKQQRGLRVWIYLWTAS